MSRLSLIAGCWLLCIAGVARAELFQQPVTQRDDHPRFARVVEKLSGAVRVRSDFRQTKTMKLLKRPLISRGDMIFDRQYGLYWHIETPFASTLIINDRQIIQRSGDQQSVLSAQQNPVAFGFAQVFFRVLTGDIDTMLQQFDLFFADGSSGWQIGLVPRDAQLRAALAKIVLYGSDDLDRIEIIDHAGDITEVAFFNRRTGGPELSEQEQLLYAF